MKNKYPSFLWRGVLGLFVFLIIGVSFIGYLHTPAGRKLPIARTLLTLVGYSCPADRITSTEMDKLRGYAAKSSEGLPKAKNKTVLSFQLNESTETEIRNWLSEKQVKCTAGERGYAFLKCADFNSFPEEWRAQGPLAEVDFSFSPNNKLIAIDILRRKMSVEQASATTENILRALKDSMGAPSLTVGSFNPTATKSFDTLVVEYSFEDYTARLNASEVPNSGVVIYEQYLYLR